MDVKKIIDLLAILLPALIILLGIIRVFVQKTKGINGLTMLFAILLLLVGLIRYYVFPDKDSTGGDHTKAIPLTVSKHSEAFNLSLEKVLTAYYQLTGDFVSADTNRIAQSAAVLKTALDSLKIDELKVDTLIWQTALQPYENTKAELAAIIADPSLAEKKASLNILSNELFTLLSTVRYDLAKLYWQECNAAFGEEKPGNWISKTEQSVNPYGQKDCAEIKTTLNFVPADTTKKQ
ncbi:MAG: DUF3347 domain-containing protein [Chitinophagales bacterium]|nr:DUF3347 domain-containing protein [Chitinophagales bacterium]